MIMKVIQVMLPEKTADELDALVKMGWFIDQSDAIRLAVSEFLSRNRLALIEQYQEDDIRWALEQKKSKDQP
jgi:Arc/MetJ-type ribon-helix-helix transcriptional regulator